MSTPRHQLAFQEPTWDQMLALQFTAYGALGKSLNLLKSQFPHLQNGHTEINLLGVTWTKWGEYT